MTATRREADVRVLIEAANSLDRIAIGSLLGARPGLVVSAAQRGPSPGKIPADVVVHAGALDPARSAAGLDGPPVLVVLREASPIPGMHALRAGAAGIACLDCHIDDLHVAVRTVAEGLGWFAPCMAKAIADHLSGRARLSGADSHGLTARELAVLKAMASGADNNAVSERLGVDVRTVKFHSSNIYRKLGARHRAEAVAIAYKLGLN